MTLNYTLSEKDYLEYYLHNYSNSEQSGKKFIRSYILVILIALIGTVFGLINKNSELSIAMGLWLVITIVFYPKYYRFQIRKHYERHIKENYSSRLGINIKLEFKDDHLFTQNHSGESKTLYSAIEQIQETPNLFLIKLGPSLAYIVPKSQLENLDSMRNKLSQLGLKVVPTKSNKWVE
jgi:hypothetical protein